jgi:hypothetical protein
MEENEKKTPMKTKPDAPMIGSDGNIYNQVAIASIALKDQGLREEAKEMSNRVFRSGSYDEALGIIAEYVTPVTRQEYNDNKDKPKRDYNR